jgi:hypothetical protein
MPTTLRPGEREYSCRLCDALAIAVEIPERGVERIDCPKCKSYEISNYAVKYLDKEEAKRRRHFAADASRREAAAGGQLKIESEECLIKIMFVEEGKQSGDDMPPEP